MLSWCFVQYGVFFLGVGDFAVKDISKLPDPCPLPEKEKKRSLNEKEKLLYAPMCGVGGVMYDKVCTDCNSIYNELF